MIRMQKLFITACALAFVLSANNLCADTIGAATSTLKPAQSEYRCQKTDESIVIDGKLDENIWRHTPTIKFYDICDGSEPLLISEGKMIWDDDYLYIGFYFEEHNICSYHAVDEANIPDKIRESITSSSLATIPPNLYYTGADSPWAHTECMIMKVDSFAKIFLDPDGNGSNYSEFHITPANNVFSAWYKQGLEGGKKVRDRFPDVAWRCPGLLTATFIDGTLNAPHDIDRAWSIECAIPWKALEPFTMGACPPRHGDLWGAPAGHIRTGLAGAINIGRGLS